jgi:hypothetical protein
MPAFDPPVDVDVELSEGEQAPRAQQTTPSVTLEIALDGQPKARGLVILLVIEAPR